MYPLVFQNESTSTNDDVLKHLNTLNSGLGLYTFNQTNGRGQYGNQWRIAKNQNLAYTLALREDVFPIKDILINFCTASTVRTFLANLTQNEVSVKWPNDLIIHRKKVGGILIEKKKWNSDFYWIIGIGINVLQNDFGELSKAGSLLSQVGVEINLTEFAESLHENLIQGLKNIDENRVLETYNQHLFNRKSVALFEINGTRQNGIIQQVDENGFLWVDLEQDGLQKFFYKEIQMHY